MINVVLAVLATGLIIEAKTDSGRVIGGAVLSASVAAVLRSVEVRT